MKIFINFVVTMLIGYPAMLAGYLAQSVVSGFSTGRFLHDRHEQAALDKFVYKVKVDTGAPND